MVVSTVPRGVAVVDMVATEVAVVATVAVAEAAEVVVVAVVAMAIPSNREMTSKMTKKTTLAGDQVDSMITATRTLHHIVEVVEEVVLSLATEAAGVVSKTRTMTDLKVLTNRTHTNREIQVSLAEVQHQPNIRLREETNLTPRVGLCLVSSFRISPPPTVKKT